MSQYFIKAFEFDGANVFITIQDCNSGDWWKLKLTADKLMGINGVEVATGHDTNYDIQEEAN